MELSFDCDTALDDICVQEAPTCPAPSMLATLGTNSSSATVYWQGAGSGSWNLEYGPAGFSQGGGTLMSVNNDTATIAGLTPAISYDFYVQEDCGINGTSQFSGPQSFMTQLCDTSGQCSHTVILSDDFGDGWNGTEVTVYQDGAPVAIFGPNFTGADGNPAGDTLVKSLGLCDSLDAYFVITTGSNTGPNWSSEIGVEVIDPFGISAGFYRR
ncbi:MAG: hypothetical protein U5L96_07150 [Owenweeksia sp.]|nr:hypothetical protein [Owenweeksia sp.]